MACVLQAHVSPGFATIGRLVDPIPVRNVATDGGLSHTNEEDIRVRRCHGNRTDGGPLEETIGDIFPIHTTISRLPDATTRGSEIKHLSMPGITCHRDDTPTTIRTYRTPFE
jgi:hypothetical protein